MAVALVNGAGAQAIITTNTPNGFRHVVVGLVVAGAGIPAATTVLSKQSQTQVTLSANLSSPITDGTVTFGGQGTLLTVANCAASAPQSRIVTTSNSFAQMVPGDLVTGGGVGSGNYIHSIDSLTQITLRNPVASHFTGATLSFGDRVDVPGAGTAIMGTIRRLRGATGVLVRMSGGTGTGTTSAYTITLHDLGGLIAQTAIGGVFAHSSSSLQMNYTWPNGAMFVSIHQPTAASATAARVGGIEGMLLDEADLAVGASGAVTSVAVDAWPIYRSAEDHHARPMSLDFGEESL
ncbi:MAG: hypothetical protein ACKVW3_01880 [Phycisphaerales bacterium]